MASSVLSFKKLFFYLTSQAGFSYQQDSAVNPDGKFTHGGFKTTTVVDTDGMNYVYRLIIMISWSLISWTYDFIGHN